MKIANATASAACDAIVDLLDDGFLRIYDGAQPTNADTAVGAQTLLAELRFNATAFGAASNGVATAGDFTQDASANATGTAAWARALASNGSTVVFDCTVGTSGTDLVLNTVSIVSGVPVDVTAMTYTVPKG